MPVGSGAVGGVVVGGGSSPPAVLAPLRPIARSKSPCAIAPTAPPYAACSPRPSMSSCSGLYTPLAIRFCAKPDAASCAASSPPAARARRT